MINKYGFIYLNSNICIVCQKMNICNMCIKI